MTRRVAISTGGGDAPGLNAVIRAAVLASINRGWECFGIRDGYDGLLDPGAFPGGGVLKLDRAAVRGITHIGGTILGTTNKGDPRRYPVCRDDGGTREVDRCDELVEAFKARGLDALIAIGGDGSLAIAHVLAQKGLKVVGVPKTIDNDLDKTVITFGFDTAVHFATECIDRLHPTAQSHRRIMVVEVMGRYAGWIALNAGVAATADVILIPEIPYDIRSVARRITARYQDGSRFAIVLVAEGAKPKGGEHFVVAREIGRQERLGGVARAVAAEIQEITGYETRVVILGHLLRGGTPTSFDRLLSLRFGAAAVRALEAGECGIMVALDPPRVRYVPLQEVTGRIRTVPLDCDTLMTARDLGISLGD